MGSRRRSQVDACGEPIGGDNMRKLIVFVCVLACGEPVEPPKLEPVVKSHTRTLLEEVDSLNAAISRFYDAGGEINFIAVVSINPHNNAPVIQFGVTSP